MSDKIDKVYELLEKVYIELQDTKIELQDTKKEVKDNGLRIGKLETIIENDIKPDIKALYQIQVNTINKLEDHDKRFDKLEEKVDALTAKTLRHSYDIGAIKRNRGIER